MPIATRPRERFVHAHSGRLVTLNDESTRILGRDNYVVHTTKVGTKVPIGRDLLNQAPAVASLQRSWRSSVVRRSSQLPPSHLHSAVHKTRFLCYINVRLILSRPSAVGTTNLGIRL